jgi:DNA sulfur modification protein DndB
MAAGFEYAFPAIRGIQANREFYVSMCPLRLLPKLFLFNEDEMIPELRAQRQLNKARLPEMARYVLENPSNYVFSAITASVDADVTFETSGTDAETRRIGVLHIPMSARFVLNDGQHRRAAIELAMRENPSIGDESIAVVFFLDQGLARCQQMFADLNRYAIRPARSLGVLYDHRDDRALLAKMVVARAPVFRDVVEMERTTLAPRSRRLFTLSAIYSATGALLAHLDLEQGEERAQIAAAYWDAIGAQIPQWGMVQTGKLSAGEVREDYLHSHGVVLQAFGRVGNVLLQSQPKSWMKTLTGLGSIDWRRGNSALWEGRALINGRVSKAQQSVLLTTNAIKNHLGLDLTPEELSAENALQRGELDNG